MTNMTDALSMVNDSRVAHSAFRVVNAIQSHTPAEQVASVALLFTMLCDHYQQDPRSMLELADRIRYDADRKEREHARALNAYIKGEL